MRILLARFALDGHDRGIITIIDACKQAGMEVIYVHFTDVEEVVVSAIEEDVEMIGITSSMGEHEYIAVRITETLQKRQAGIPLIMGGVIPTADVPKLLGMGVKRIFGPGTSPLEAVSFIFQILGKE